MPKKEKIKHGSRSTPREKRIVDRLVEQYYRMLPVEEREDQDYGLGDPFKHDPLKFYYGNSPYFW